MVIGTDPKEFSGFAVLLIDGLIPSTNYDVQFSAKFPPGTPSPQAEILLLQADGSESPAAPQTPFKEPSAEVGVQSADDTNSSKLMDDRKTASSSNEPPPAPTTEVYVCYLFMSYYFFTAF